MAQNEIDAARAGAAKLVERTGGEKGFSDTNYIFLSFVTRYLPAGIVGLVIAVIFAATMSASSGEINSLATVTVVDIYQRHFRRGAGDHHYLMASRWATLFWGVYAVVFAGWGKQLGSLIVAVNVVGSLFYGSLLGCFVLAFRLPRECAARPRSSGMLAGEAAIFATAFFTGCFLALVQRDRLRGGGGRRLAYHVRGAREPLPPRQISSRKNERPRLRRRTGSGRCSAPPLSTLAQEVAQPDESTSPTGSRRSRRTGRTVGYSRSLMPAA